MTVRQEASSEKDFRFSMLRCAAAFFDVYELTVLPPRELHLQWRVRQSLVVVAV